MIKVTFFVGKSVDRLTILRGKHMEILKHCPFCGKSESVILTTAKLMEDCKHFEDSGECSCFKYDEPCGAYIVVCDYTQGGCGASCGYASSKEKAIRKWNMRT